MLDIVPLFYTEYAINLQLPDEDDKQPIIHPEVVSSEQI